jgi:hypothetical protein
VDIVYSSHRRLLCIWDRVYFALAWVFRAALETALQFWMALGWYRSIELHGGRS